ncbi:MAG: DNA mismatch repair protein MutT [Candidatus Cloacimonadota bacterium]|nr:MAG: DNA mismatch repair protein MutT [Candidatus Cloacimonadota bacterium]
MIINEGKFLRFCKEGTWEYVERSNCSGAVIILSKTKDNKVLFVEQFRPPVKKNVIELPAGLIGDEKDPSESCLLAAKRELIEETGYEAKEIEYLFGGPISAGLSNEMLYFVYAHDLTKVSGGGGVEGENIIVHEIEVSEVDQFLKEQVKMGKLIDPKLYLFLAHLR